MTYLVIFNGHRGVIKETVRAKHWREFLDFLDRLVGHYGEPPDMIYLISMRD